MYKEITSRTDYIKFSKAYMPYVKTLEHCDKVRLMSFQGSQKDDSFKEIKMAADNAFKNIPALDCNIIAWRSGSLSPNNRTYLNASFFKSMAKNYKNENSLHKIILKKGSKVLPLFALGEEIGAGSGEIIINKNYLHRKYLFFGPYIYKA